MLQTSPTPDIPPATPDMNMPMEDAEVALQTLMDALQASPGFLAPELTSSPQFLTSPMESPWDEFLQTPALGTDSGGDFSPDILTSPALFDSGDSLYDGLPLFGDFNITEYAKPPTSLDGLYTLSPHLDSLNPSPAIQDDSSFAVPAPPTSRRKSAPTGTRKNVTPESLIPLDAPIQSRKYLTPSATSRKDLPATFARKRSRSIAFNEDEDEGTGANPSTVVEGDEEEAIKTKRLQNTLAARRSRKRKLEHQRLLEDEAAGHKASAEAWRAYAVQCRTMLEAAGLHPPPLTPDLVNL